VDLDGDLDCLNVPTQEHCTLEGGAGLFFPNDVCVAAPGHAPKLGDWCVPKAPVKQQRDCTTTSPPIGPEDCFVLPTGACCGVGPCQQLTTSQCAELGGTYLGNGTNCPCNIPALTGWGLAVLVLLGTTAGAVVFRRRLAARA
jgi:hypothetical protein